MSDDALPPVSRLLGREWLGFDETGKVGLVRYQADAVFLNRHGTVQGGLLAAMLDSATGLRALQALAANRTIVTTWLDTRFLKPARVGEIFARAWIVEQTSREIKVMAELTDAGGAKLAEATANLRILTKS